MVESVSKTSNLAFKLEFCRFSSLLKVIIVGLFFKILYPRLSFTSIVLPFDKITLDKLIYSVVKFAFGILTLNFEFPTPDTVYCFPSITTFLGA